MGALNTLGSNLTNKSVKTKLNIMRYKVLSFGSVVGSGYHAMAGYIPTTFLIRRKKRDNRGKKKVLMRLVPLSLRLVMYRSLVKVRSRLNLGII